MTTTEHVPKYQNAPVGRFVVCSCSWRSSFGDRKQNNEDYARHLKGQS